MVKAKPIAMLINMQIFSVMEQMDATWALFFIIVQLQYVFPELIPLELYHLRIRYDFIIQKDVLELAQIVAPQYSTELDARTMEYIQAYAVNNCIIFCLWVIQWEKINPAGNPGMVIQVSVSWENCANDN